MTEITANELAQDLERYLDQVATSNEPVAITRGSGSGKVMLVSERDYEGWQETAYLLQDPANAAHLLASIRELDGLDTSHTQRATSSVFSFSETTMELRERAEEAVSAPTHQTQSTSVPG